MKTLNTIQVLSKIGKVLSTIVFVCCIVGLIGCIVGIIALALGAGTFKAGGVTIQTIIADNTDMNIPTMYSVMAAGIVLCLSEVILSGSARKYFKNELADGTPFTYRGANELKRLGIKTIVIPIIAVIICAAGIGIAHSMVPEIEMRSFGDYASVGLGIMMLILSLFCRYGAEKAEEKERDTVFENTEF